MTCTVPTTFGELERILAQRLRWPENVGIQLRKIELPCLSVRILFVEGLAREDIIHTYILAPLGQAAQSLTAVSVDMLCSRLPAPRVRQVREMDGAIAAALQGAAVLFVQGEDRSIVVETGVRRDDQLGAFTQEHPSKEMLTTSILDNVALLRQRVRSERLLAIRLLEAPPENGALVIAYLDDTATPSVVQAVREWAVRFGREETFTRGHAGRPWSLIGGLPHCMQVQDADKVAQLLTEGCVAILMERARLALVAPVSLPGILTAPGDSITRRPVIGVARWLRTFLALLIISGAGMVVALMNYHPEMIPTAVVLGLAATRENAAFPILFEVIFIEGLHETIRESAARLPVRVTEGQAVIAGAILSLLLVLTGLIGPLPAFGSIFVSITLYAMPSYEVDRLVRIWRWYTIAGAAIFGIYGISAVLFLLFTYLVHLRSFGVPVVGETGIHYRTAGVWASRPMGGKRFENARAIQ